MARLALVTGTSTGIGRGIAIHLARRGFECSPAIPTPTKARRVRSSGGAVRSPRRERGVQRASDRVGLRRYERARGVKARVLCGPAEHGVSDPARVLGALPSEQVLGELPQPVALGGGRSRPGGTDGVFALEHQQLQLELDPAGAHVAVDGGRQDRGCVALARATESPSPDLDSARVAGATALDSTRSIRS
jgi:hypothetical protein